MIDLKNIKVVNTNEELPCLGGTVTIILMFDNRIITTTDVYENTSLTWIEAFKLGVFKHCDYAFENEDIIIADTPEGMHYVWVGLYYMVTDTEDPYPVSIPLTDSMSQYFSQIPSEDSKLIVFCSNGK